MRKFFSSILLGITLAILNGCTSQLQSNTPSPSIPNNTDSTNQSSTISPAPQTNTKQTNDTKIGQENKQEFGNGNYWISYNFNSAFSFRMNSLNDFIVVNVQNFDQKQTESLEIGGMYMESLNGIKSLQELAKEGVGDSGGLAGIAINFYKNPEKLDAKAWTIQNNKLSGYSPEEAKNDKTLYINGKKAFLFTGEGIGKIHNYTIGIEEYIVVLRGEEPILDEFTIMAKTADFELKKK